MADNCPIHILSELIPMKLSNPSLLTQQRSSERKSPDYLVGSEWMRPFFKYYRSALALSLIASIITISSSTVNAAEIPTTPAAWTGTNVTTGTGNTEAATKDTPSGLRMRVTVGGSNTGVLARNNTTLMTQGNVLVPVLPATTNGLQLLTDFSNCPNGTTVLTCSNRGSFGVEFLDTANTPIKVRNPILHWSRLGGAKSQSSGGVVTASFLASVILELSTPNLKFNSVSGSSLAVSPGVNNNIRWAFPTTAPTTAGVCATTTSSAGCGSTPITDVNGGSILVDRLDFNVTGERNNGSILWNVTDSAGLPTVTQDGYFLTASFEEDYGDAPATFDVGGAATHIISDLSLGSTIDADNSNVINGGATGTPLVGASPNAVAAGTSNNGTIGDGADENGVGAWAPLTTNATTYSTTVAISGVSRAARVCSWIDFNRNNTFDNPTERACADVAIGQTSATLNWTGISGLTAGQNYARVRLSYDLTGVQNPKGALNSGEVEDYQIPIAAPATTLDYGDAPATYDSGTAASHLVPTAPTVYLGTLPPDQELTPNTPLNGSGDNSNGTNDEDGVTFAGGTTLNAGATASVSVATRGTGVLHAWIDFNGNGTFESSERITNWVEGNSSTGGTTTLTFGVPEGFTGTTYARFRYSSDVAAANPTGSANDGEVEDYQITLAPRLTPATYTNGTPIRKGFCSIYSATGADQVVTAPAGARGLTVKLWGAGGGHEIVGTGYAGAGGYTDAQFGSSVVTPGAQFTLVVGRGGMSGGRPDEFSPTAVYGFGAVAGHEQGGGLAGLFTGGSAVIETDRARALAIAGGGGGYEHSGGSGTGTTGGNGNGSSSGGQSTMRGSTDNLTRTNNSSVIMTAHISSGGGGYQGGGRLPAPNPYSAVTGGNLANIAAASGGSGFVAATATSGRILSTTDGIGTPPNTSDSDYLTGIGTAGTLSMNPGGDARAVLCWDVSDYGDAPATYDVGTPASHLLSSSPSVYLGAIAPDGESAAQPNVAANGDNTSDTSDEDAFMTLSNVPTIGSYSLNNIPVKNISGTAATLQAWIDFNKDGVFQASEYTSVSIPANATTANLDWASVPAGTTAGSTYARFRITTDALSDNTATTEDERSFESASDGEVEDYAITIAASKAKLILVKRITAIKDGVTNATTNYPGSIADLNLTDLANYSNCNWPTATGTAGACTNTYLAGATTTTVPKVKSGDEVEYTIYYLNAGGNKATARVCDRLNPSLTFQPDFDDSNTGKGIGFKPGTTNITYLTNIGTDTDKGQLTDASTTSCNLPSNAGTQVIAVDVGDAATPLLGSTGAGAPSTSYGYIRFKVKVN
jgi:uncharacterized repeat protein (TIGR01451 family)